MKTVQALDLALADLRFDESANTIYHFVWATFCDWYLELIKPARSATSGRDRRRSRAVAGWVLDQILVMLHPFMPFVTEELWNAMGERPYPLIVAKWPMPDARALDPEAGPEIDWLIRLVERHPRRPGRAERAAGREAAAARPATPDAQTAERLERNAAALQRLARIELDQHRARRRAARPRSSSTRRPSSCRSKA